MDQRFQQWLWPAPKQPRLPERRRLRAFAGIIGRTVSAPLGPTGASSAASTNAESCNSERVVLAVSAIVVPAANPDSVATTGNELLMPLRNQSNIVSVVEPPRKRSQTTAGGVLKNQHLGKALAQGLANNHGQLRSADGYCNTMLSENLCSALVRLTKKNPALMEVTKGRNQSNPALVANATDVLDRLVPP
jgi:hypothetical protein